MIAHRWEKDEKIAIKIAWLRAYKEMKSALKQIESVKWTGQNAKRIAQEALANVKELEFVRARNSYHDIVDILYTIDSLCELVDAGDVFDAHSPIWDAIRDIIKEAETHNA